ncbi:hypothetical protein Caci_7120 [Catenulispora acidiphila DSM 44928]|uniref:DUF1003 domain-containing protein n=1 Tax=Catenulispora acidiphila (strain DSM 44928 / JCM 14897 / NBRC 102108 / NRRL B-24433 / ID139908) TaxID=479433 RepID=C7Q6T7_CATAD|nr:hypothetical protein Caci_7120 [Catenulispora acidiphila DSM 44928]
MTHYLTSLALLYASVSLYTSMRHPHVHMRLRHGHARVEHEFAGAGGRLAAWITRRLGSMWTVYVCVALTMAWILLGSRTFLGFDPYPYPFMLFLGNMAQLLLIFVILLGQQVLGRTGDRRAIQTFEDAEAILHDCEQIQNHLIAQDAHLAACVVLDELEQFQLTAAAERFTTPPTMADEHISANARLAARITARCGTMSAFYIAAAFQMVWIVLAQTGVLRFDKYPFAFLLFLSSLAQLLLMFVIMLGQQVLGRAADRRAEMTFRDAEAVLRACERLQAHLRAQDLAIRHVVDHMTTCGSAEHR